MYRLYPGCILRATTQVFGSVTRAHHASSWARNNENGTPKVLIRSNGTDASKSTSDSKSSSKPFTRGILLGGYSLMCIALGVFITTTPLAGLMMQWMFSSDDGIPRKYNPEDATAQAVEFHINNHPLSAELRTNPSLTESRPHLMVPYPMRHHNLTAGTLLGAGRITTPPFIWRDKGGRLLVLITHLGTDICGHPGIIHGGALSTLLDEGLARCCFEAMPRKTAVTAKLEVNFRKITPAGSYVVLRASTVKVEGRKAWVEGRIETLPEPGKPAIVLAEASGLFISPSPAKVLKTLLY